MKQLLFYDRQKQANFEEGIRSAFNLLKDSITELKNQGVAGYTCEDLKDGEFVQTFNNFHKKQQLKSSVTKNMLFDKFLELYGYNSELLAKLENTYKSRIKSEYFFYSFNHQFYDYCETMYGYHSNLKSFLNNAPKKKSYKVFNFLTIKGNNCQISVPKELFTLYSTNDKQLKIMENVKSYVQLSKELNIEYKDVLKPIEKYLDHKISNWAGVNRLGLSQDLNEVNFDYNKILTIQ
ncbi:hypothetical protein [Arenibacter sp. F20364]|uniref:hypothetical protein n=1 Tax=Arenibacter sp. F20364 TaxID=2926415 RepID=UPI001FF52F6B|nr:hypothetical protein [Arenibacter sp. F20364]MCK0190657.1 hypothetical protein [Arenibacter sp. F20364]